MQPHDPTLTTFFDSWRRYQDGIRQAIAPLTADQLALRAAPHLRSICETAIHIVGCRMFWFTGFLGEACDEGLNGYERWNRVALGAPYATVNGLELALGAPAPSAVELAEALDRTWRFMADRLARWSPAEMRQTIQDEDDGVPVEISRAWVVWHVLEHDLHHGGEISLTLGAHGLQAPDI